MLFLKNTSQCPSLWTLLQQTAKWYKGNPSFLCGPGKRRKTVQLMGSVIFIWIFSPLDSSSPATLKRYVLIAETCKVCLNEKASLNPGTA